MEITENGMDKEQFAVWLFDCHNDDVKSANDPDRLIQDYAAVCENIQDGTLFCEVRAHHSATGNPMPFSMPEAWFQEGGGASTAVSDAAHAVGAGHASALPHIETGREGAGDCRNYQNWVKTADRSAKGYSKKLRIEVELWVTHVSDTPGIADFRKSTGAAESGYDWRAAACYPNGHMVWEWFKTENDAIAWCDNFNGGAR